MFGNLELAHPRESVVHVLYLPVPSLLFSFWNLLEIKGHALITILN